MRNDRPGTCKEISTRPDLRKRPYPQHGFTPLTSPDLRCCDVKAPGCPHAAGRGDGGTRR